jgi:hypothetical protein
MTNVRKGQHLFNALATKYRLGQQYEGLHKILFYMTDKEFDEIMATVQENSKR